VQTIRTLFLLLLLSSPLLRAAGSLVLTVKDPQGALVGGATANVTGQSGNVPLAKFTDSQGRAVFDSLPSESYRVVVTREGFDAWEHNVTVSDRAVNLAVTLKLATVASAIRVSATRSRSPLANSDPNYKAIRQGKLSTVYRVNNLVLKRDTATFTFRSGSFSFLPPVLGHVTLGVFVGDGNFSLQPAYELATAHLHRIMGADSVNEDFAAVAIWFSDSTFDEVKQHSEPADESSYREEEALRQVREIIETRREPGGLPPLTMLERTLNYEDVPNYDAEILEELYNGEHDSEPSGSFRAIIHGKKHPDLRYLLNPHGAMPTLPAPEEVALLNFDRNSDSDGIWYLSHLVAELQSGRETSDEDKRLIAPDHYRIESLIRRENLIGNFPDLAATCALKFHALRNGVRMVKFDLVPDLQVSRVLWNGKEIPFVQEARNQDGSFYLQTPAALVKDRSYEVTFEYGGGEILQSKFDSRVSRVPLRRNWYPLPAGPANRATYDLIFRMPRGGNVATLGKLVSQTREGQYDVQEWICDAPIPLAAFRYLDFESAAHKTDMEETTNTALSLWVTEPVAGRQGRMFLPPSMKNLLIDVGNSLRVFQWWFGKPAYDSLTVLVTPAHDSLPGLVVVPPSGVAGFGSRVVQAQVNAGIPVGRGGFRSVNAPVPQTERVPLDEEFPTMIAQQWWGNTVSPVSFHDQWLVDGLANFSASLFDSEVNDEYKDHWTTAREAILGAGQWGQTNLIGPVWMGLLNVEAKWTVASSRLNVSKGGYILQMLRSIMWDPHTGDEDFRATIQDFLSQYKNRAVSTEDFRAVVEKRMKPNMDLDHNHRMHWFFDEWVFTTDVPSYRLEYSLKPDGNGKTVLSGRLTQSGVLPEFRMLVPVFADVGGNKERIFVASMAGSETGDFSVTLGERPKRILLNINHDILTEKDEVTLVK